MSAHTRLVLFRATKWALNTLVWPGREGAEQGQRCRLEEGEQEPGRAAGCVSGRAAVRVAVRGEAAWPLWALRAEGAGWGGALQPQWTGAQAAAGPQKPLGTQDPGGQDIALPGPRSPGHQCSRPAQDGPGAQRADGRLAQSSSRVPAWPLSPALLVR